MLIATDGACKRNGQPDCISAGVAWIMTETGDMLFKSKVESRSTSQRGEINGLICALEYASTHMGPDEDIIIISDSEYLCNTVGLEWCMKWRANNWISASGEPAKNADMWEYVCSLIDIINADSEHLFMQWTKGHLVSYTPGNVKYSMRDDPTGISLHSNIVSIANRGSEKDRIINDFLKERHDHNKTQAPRKLALDWVVANVTADCLAGYLVNLANDLWIQKQVENFKF